METLKDLLTGDTTYHLKLESLTMTMLGPSRGEVRLNCTSEGVARAVEAVIHPSAATVREHAAELASSAAWDLPVAELETLPDRCQVTIKAVLASAGFAGRKVGSSEEAGNLMRQALQHGTWRVDDLEVEA